MSAPPDEVGHFYLSGFCVSSDRGLHHIYSPSKLYSVLNSEKIEYGSYLKELVIFNTATRIASTYTINKSPNNAYFKVNCLYWLADFMLVAVVQEHTKIKQLSYLVDHCSKCIVKDKERVYELKRNALNTKFQSQYCLHIPTISLDEKDYLSWPGNADIYDGHFCQLLIPKNPLINLNIKQFIVNISLGTSMRNEIRSFLSPETGEFLYVSFPVFSNKTELLCRILVFEDRRTLALDGIFVAYDVTKLIDIFGTTDYDLMELDSMQGSAVQLIVIPDLSNSAPVDINDLTAYKSSAVDNQLLTVMPRTECFELRLINFTTLESKRKTVKSGRFDRFSLHPNGIVLNWKQTADKIIYKKINFYWKSESLMDITWKSVIFGRTTISLKENGLQPILFPGSEIIYKPQVAIVPKSECDRLPPILLYLVAFIGWICNVLYNSAQNNYSFYFPE